MEVTDELAGHAAYNAFLGELRAFLPHEASAWDELPMPLKQAWTAAAIAAKQSAVDSRSSLAEIQANEQRPTTGD